MGHLKSIAIKSTAKADMQILESAEITVAKGITDDFRGSQTDRQVTIISESAWRKACDTINADLAWTTRRANLLVDGNFGVFHWTALVNKFQYNQQL